MQLWFIRHWLKLLAGAVVSGCALYIALALWVGSQVGVDTRTNSAVVLVLGARAYLQGRPNPCLVARVKHGVDLVRSGYAPLLLVSGGTDVEDGRNEAEVMKQLAIGFGLAESQIVLEPNATSTYENLSLSQAIMAEKGLDSVLIVTEPFHTPRAAALARKMGLRFAVSPAPNSPCWQRWGFSGRFFLREPLAVANDWLRGAL
jgi:uncharacterized SAM-binding protein YcdF (DUF218 family)